jgi:hypothetical protein
MGSPAQSSRPNLALRDGQGFRIKPLFSAGAKEVESGVKERQIRRPFHSDCDLLRSQRTSGTSMTLRSGRNA